MDLSKSFEYFSPNDVKGQVHVLGCGSVGSAVAELLARLGIDEKIHLWDFDKVESHNLVNQMFNDADVGSFKVDATERLWKAINPMAKITKHPKGWNGERLSGYVFLAVDNIDLRREICKKNRMNPMMKALFDFRTGLESGQCYAADWSNLTQIDNLLESMAFSHDEAKANTPVTACGLALGLAPTVRGCVLLGVCNFMNFIKKSYPLQQIMVFNPFKADIY